ncbi:hypothetical protein CTRI78_v009824 [Colletotrichum trifolii]|uniref:Uncharacterized protein n=1 Tax=Colletotrichum trifolii TaxID=5466 RepID=A0A4R8R041_COLTR|nr:hypothetical protein CTRI78_v009824 [Colletotrichum trifolii]
MKFTSNLTLLALALLPAVICGPIEYGICQSGCAAILRACYVPKGARWREEGGFPAPPSTKKCDDAFWDCQDRCEIVAYAPGL